MTPLEQIANETARKYSDAIDKFCLDIYAKYYSIDQLKFAFREKHKLAEFFKDEGWELRLYNPGWIVEMRRHNEVMGRFEFKVNYV